ncbi:MAG: hypothetical protein AAGA30_02385 [Planctomycetota bacterium]
MYQLAVVVLAIFFFGCSQPQEETVREYAEDNPDVSIRELSNGTWKLRIWKNNSVLPDLLPHLANSDKKLSFINIANVDVQANQFQQILDLPITYLWVTGGSVHIPKDLVLKNKSKLRRLRITSSKLSGPLAPSLMQLEELVELDLGNTTFDKGTFQTSVFDNHVFPNLEKVELGSSDLTDQDLKQIAEKLPNLKWLGVHDTRVTGSGLKNLAPIHSLETVQFPDGIPIEDALSARKVHIEAKRAARKAGIRVPADERSPFGGSLARASEEQLAASGLLPDKRVEKARGLLEQKIMNLIGSQKGMKVVYQVNEIIPEFASKKNYVEDKRSLAEILEQDFGIEFEDALRTRKRHPIKHPDDWGKIPEQSLRYYLSGKLDKAIPHLENER